MDEDSKKQTSTAVMKVTSKEAETIEEGCMWMTTCQMQIPGRVVEGFRWECLEWGCVLCDHRANL